MWNATQALMRYWAEFIWILPIYLADRRVSVSCGCQR